jgi:predicted nucleotidyltransferase
MEWAPPWLGRAYCKLYATLGEDEMLLDTALECMQEPRERGRVILSELVRRGYLKRLSRGRYAALNPAAIAFGVAVGSKPYSIMQNEYEPLLREVMAKLFETFRQNLVSVVLYGSVARGTAGLTSDMDLLLVARGLPESFYDRAKIISGILRQVHDSKVRLWKKSGRYTNVDIFPLTPEEAQIPRLLYLDFLFDSTILYDQDNFMRGVLEKMRDQIKQTGGRRITLPSGKWYWSLHERYRKGVEIAV